MDQEIFFLNESDARFCLPREEGRGEAYMYRFVRQFYHFFENSLDNFRVFDTFKENGKNILIFPYYLIIHIQLSYVLSYNKSDR